MVPMEGHPELTVSPPFRSLRRRQWAVTAWDLFWTVATVVLFVGAGALVADRIRLELAGGGSTAFDSAPRVAVALAAVLGLAVGAAALVAWRRRPSPSGLALAVDARAGSAEAITTALDLASRDDRSPFRRLVEEAARATLDEVRPARIFPWPRIGSRGIALLPLAIVLWIGALPIPGAASADAASPRPTPPKDKAQTASQEPRKQPRSPAKPPPPKTAPSSVPPTGQPPPPPGKNPPPANGGAGGGEEPQPRPVPAPRPKSHDAGTETAEELFGDPSRTEVKKRPESVNPLVGEGAVKSRDLAVNLPDEAAPPTPSPEPGTPPDKPVPTPYPSIYRKYAKVAEDAVAGERVPAEDRDLVRRYFESIRPK